MNDTLFVIAIAVGAAVVSTLLAVFMQGRELTPKAKRALRVTLAAGVVALIAFGAIVLIQ